MTIFKRGLSSSDIIAIVGVVLGSLLTAIGAYYGWKSYKHFKETHRNPAITVTRAARIVDDEPITFPQNVFPSQPFDRNSHSHVHSSTPSGINWGDPIGPYEW